MVFLSAPRQVGKTTLAMDALPDAAYFNYDFAMTMAAAGMSANAASGVIELEIPGMNEETAARIADFRTNACPATVAALRDSIDTNYDGVVLR